MPLRAICCVMRRMLSSLSIRRVGSKEIVALLMCNQSFPMMISSNSSLLTMKREGIRRLLSIAGTLTACSASFSVGVPSELKI